MAASLANRVEEEVRSLNFKETYGNNVQPIIRKVESFIQRSILSGREVLTHPSSLDVDIDALLHVLRKTSPLIGDYLKIYSSNISMHLEIIFLNNIPRGSANLRQHFKKPLVINYYDCIPCKSGMFFFLQL